VGNKRLNQRGDLEQYFRLIQRKKIPILLLFDALQLLFQHRMRTNNFCVAIFALISCFFFGEMRVYAQLPAFVITSEQPEFGAVQDGRLNIVLRERRFTMMTYDTLPQRGRIVIRRTRATTATLTLRMGVSYQSGTRLLPESTTATMMLPNIFTDANGRTQRLPANERPTAVPINSLFGDLNPIFVVNGVAAGQVGTTYTQTYQVSFPPSVTEASIVCTARWSDQSFPSNPGRQNPRTLFVALLPGEGYIVPSSGSFQDFARITLEDPENTPPILLPQGRNFCQMLAVNAAGTTIPLENTQLDAMGMSQSFFYDDNYDPLLYSLTNSNSDALTARITASDQRFGNLPTLTLSANPNVRSTMANLVITAIDNRGPGQASTVCPPINVITSVLREQPISPASLRPNPASNEAALRFTLARAMAVRIEVYSVLGEKLLERDLGLIPQGEHQHFLSVDTLPAGVFPVRVIAEGQIESVLMRVVR
jgi:hypothetical protein